MKKFNLKIIKKILAYTGIVLLVIVAALAVAVLSLTTGIDRASYFDSDYYKKSIQHLDSLRSNHASVHHSLEAGFSKVSITPGLHYPEDNVAEGKFKNVTLGGYSARRGRYATGIHDSIFVSAAAIRVAGNLMVVIGTDLLIIPHNITDTVLSMLRGDGITREQLMFTASHSHSSLGGWGMGFMGSASAGESNPNIVYWLSAQIAKAVREAVGDLKPAMIGSGNVPAAMHTRNRIVGGRGTKNDDFSYIILEQIDGKKAIVGSYSAHTTILSARNMEVSAEYSGVWARRMERDFADYAIFCGGAMGSQSPVADHGEPFERVQLFGEALADTVLQYAAMTPMTDSVVFSAVTMKFNLPEYNIRIWSRRSLGPYLSNKMVPTYEQSVLQALRLNDMVWLSAPADFSGEIALMVKNYLLPKGFEANVVGFNGSYLGYIIPSKYFFIDMYESKDMGWYGPNFGDYTTDMLRQLSDIVIR